MARVVTGNAMTPVLACFVVLGTATAIYLLNQGDPEPRGENAEAEGVFEIDPALPRISLLPDSVPDEANDPDPGESTSLLDGFEWHDERARRRRFEQSLAEAVGDVHGLGVYVEPPKKDAGKEKR